ncbi:hypothetical protein B0H66DRAFT_549766 [Apodospora peruviana]|uniref:Uncharacterized protein n=1 Tax=Apodospora peruviana TaxID=516989 RepID=A0AAE0IJ36_9PEZI|nr:hypothetical protein B0H66DRAFT_549766 [Apodospora peruviana]
MKLFTTTTSLTAVLTFIGNAAARWDCESPSGGPGFDALRADHQAFNRAFGNPRLTADAEKCFVSRCNGRDLAWCNMTPARKSEISNERNVMAATSPGTGKNCFWVVDGGAYLWYADNYSMMWPAASVDIRRC